MLCDDIFDCTMVMIILFTESAGELVIHSYLPESGPATHNNKEEMIILTGKLPKGKSISSSTYLLQPTTEGIGKCDENVL